MGLLSALGKRGARMLERPWTQPLNVASPVGESLSSRQMQMLELSAAGKSDEQIAALFGMEPKLVEMILGRANGKVGAERGYRGWSDGMLPPGMF